MSTLETNSIGMTQKVHPTLQLSYWWIIFLLYTLIVTLTSIAEIGFFFLNLPEISFFIALVFYNFNADKMVHHISFTFNQLPTVYHTLLQKGIKTQNIINVCVLIPSFIYSVYLIFNFLNHTI